MAIAILIGIYFRRRRRSYDRERQSRSKISAANPIALDLVLTPNRMHGQGSMIVNPDEWESDNVYNVLHHPTDQAARRVSVYANKSQALDYEQLGDELHPRFEARAVTNPIPQNAATSEYEEMVNNDDQTTRRRDGFNPKAPPHSGMSANRVPMPWNSELKPNKMYESTTTSANPGKLTGAKTLQQSNIEYEEVVIDDQTSRDDVYTNMTQPPKNNQYGGETENASGTTEDHYSFI